MSQAPGDGAGAFLKSSDIFNAERFELMAELVAACCHIDLSSVGTTEATAFRKTKTTTTKSPLKAEKEPV